MIFYYQTDGPITRGLINGNLWCQANVLCYICSDMNSSVQTQASTTEEHTSQPDLKSLFLEISEEVGSLWKDVCQNLLKKDFFARNIDDECTGVKEKAYQVLLRWYHRNGSGATVEDLFRALVQSDCSDAAAKLVQLVPSLSSLSQFTCVALQKELVLFNTTERVGNFKCEKCMECGHHVMVSWIKTNVK